MNAPKPAALSVLVVDDEPLARLRLCSLLSGCREPAAWVVGQAADAPSALAAARELKPEVMLLDIALPGASGLQLAQGLRTLVPAPAIVFVTAHAQHALQAFELDAVDYLTKPVRAERLQAALQRVAQRALALQPALWPAAAQQALVVSDRGRVLRIALHEVLYLKAEAKYVTLRTAQHRYVLDDALSDLEQRLGPGFIRIHRNALVARSAVRALERRVLADEPGNEGWAVQVAPVGEWLAVSRRLAGPVREALLQHAG